MPERCWHELLPGQCGICTPPAPSIALARAHAQRVHGYVPDAPQVSATTVAQPTTDRLERALGYDIPRIGYGHWGVQVDDSATAELRAQRQRAHERAQRQALADALLMPRASALEATITIREAA